MVDTGLVIGMTSESLAVGILGTVGIDVKGLVALRLKANFDFGTADNRKSSSIFSNSFNC